jgi:hypothetical protein
MIPKKIKISNYRPYGILARDPNESTYEYGDNNFTPIADVQDAEFAKELVRRYNEYEELLKRAQSDCQI